ncbi:MAG: GNAT family N-acetyltransferase [Planctomycetaceae bacterium]|nr:GNAT family N-acetyltransferase [Planctomycetaceae bacterium]
MIRLAQIDDLAAIALVESLSWPPGMESNEAVLAARLRAFPAGQLVAEADGGGIIAYAAAQRIHAAQLTTQPLTFDALTDSGRFTHSHDEHGDVYQLIGVAVMPTERGSGTARALVDRQIEQARQLPGVHRIVGFTRPARYHRHAELSIEAYVNLRDARGQLVDPVLGFHLNAGAKLVQICPNFRPSDYEALGYGVLIEYSLGDD